MNLLRGIAALATSVTRCDTERFTAPCSVSFGRMRCVLVVLAADFTTSARR
jgi:hypothetical protein